MKEIPVTYNVARQQVVGMFHRPAGRGPFPAVMFLHGFTGSKIESHRLFVETARALASAGIAALRFDFRGCGDSAGLFRDMTVSGECADARAALRFLKRHPDVDAKRLGLLGMSMGGMIAALTLAETRAFRCAVLWNPVATPCQLRDRRMETGMPEQLKTLGVVDQGGWIVCAKFLHELGEVAPLEAAARIRTPVLLVVGTEDDVVPPGNAADYHAVLERNRCPVHTHAVAGAGHAFGSMAHRDEAMAATTAWFKQRLLC
jgi:dienelactone hydrolase